MEHLRVETAGATDLLRVRTGYGGQIHLVAPFPILTLPGRVWSERTLCDRHWQRMASEADERHFARHAYDLFATTPLSPDEPDRDVRCPKCWSALEAC